MTFDIQEILGFLPHRYPFLLIDRIVEFEPAKRLVAIKNVTINEPFFQGHFPGYPIMPGVLVIEAMAQAGAIIMMEEIPDREKKLVVFTGIERAKFRRPVTPGDQLRIEVDVLARSRPASAAWKAKAYVDGKLACQATLTCQVVPKVREHHPTAPEAAATPEAATAHKAVDRSEHSSQRVVSAGAVVPASCTVGPFAPSAPRWFWVKDCTLISHVVLDGRTRIGARNIVYPFCSIGVPPQDLKYGGEPTETVLGDDNTIRESVTISRGTQGGGGITRIGSNCLLMTCVHIGHDSQVGSHCILANAATLAGHVIIEDYVTLGAFCPVHQHCIVGQHAFIGGGTIVTQDVLPFSKTSSRRENKAFGATAWGWSAGASARSGSGRCRRPSGCCWCRS
jgi:UDP-N-acetylglucosamine acyltransferase